MRGLTGHPAGTVDVPSGTHQADLRWEGQAVRVAAPVPASVWAAVAAADPTTMPFHTPAWRDCVQEASGWRDASRLYETAGGRQLVLMMARRTVAPGLAVEASWPAGWGAGGILAPGGVRPEEAALVSADLARGRALSTAVRPGFAAAPAWPAATGAAFTIPRAVHVAHFGGACFEDYWARSISAKTRQRIRNARRHLKQAGAVISSGNSPELVDAFYEVYLRWAGWHAAQRKVPGPIARWQAGRAEPFAKFATVAGALGPDCRIWVARWDGRPVGAMMSLYAGESAVGWRSFIDRTIPGRFRLFEVLAIESLRHACESGCRTFEMGESVGRRDLAAVKERVGGAEHPFTEYCFERLPLSPGRIAFQHVRRRAEERVIPHGAWRPPRRAS